MCSRICLFFQLQDMNLAWCYTDYNTSLSRNTHVLCMYMCMCMYDCLCTPGVVSYHLKYSNQSMDSQDLKDSNQAPTFQSTNYKCFYYCYL